MKYKKIFFFISALFLLPCFYALIAWGLQPSIDFTGGTILELRMPEFEKQKVEEVVRKREIELSSIQESNNQAYILKTKEISKDQKEKLLSGLNQELGQIDEIRFETLGPSIGKELIRKTLMAIFLAAGFILFYVAWRFKDRKYGICAILGMFHDTIILVGSFAILGHFLGVEVDTLFVTAVLTILSFSVHDTVVVYDQVRQLNRQNPSTDFVELVDRAVIQTLPRSINNSLTIIFMLLSLYLLGGQTIRWFSLALLIGTIAGTYSSTFIAAPLLIVWENLKKKRK